MSTEGNPMRLNPGRRPIVPVDKSSTEPATPPIPLSDQERAGPDDDWKRPGASIQWKGTNVCLDFHCPCGANGHVDDDFVYGIQCPTCGRIFAMPMEVGLTEGDPGGFNVVTAEVSW